jgi:hypothetical protein
MNKSPRDTCYGCKKLKHTDLLDLEVYYCKPNGLVIPHETESDGPVTFTRVPLFCPLTDADVNKREHPAPKSLQVTINEKV